MPHTKLAAGAWSRIILSDHQYIEVILGTACQPVRRPPSGGEKRWALTKLDDERLETAFMATSWGLQDEEEGEWDIHRDVDWLRDTMHCICDDAMPRAKSHPPRRATYWWTDEMEFRRSSVQARRVLSWFPKDGDDDEREETLAAFRNARCALSRALDGLGRNVETSYSRP